MTAEGRVEIDYPQIRSTQNVIKRKREWKKWRSDSRISIWKARLSCRRCEGAGAICPNNYGYGVGILMELIMRLRSVRRCRCRYIPAR